MAIIARQLIQSCVVARNLTPINRSIMTSSSRAEKVVEDLQNNPYFEKYAQKIATLQKASPEDFLARIDANEKAKSKPKFGGVKER